MGASLARREVGEGPRCVLSGERRYRARRREIVGPPKRYPKRPCPAFTARDGAFVGPPTHGRSSTPRYRRRRHSLRTGLDLDRLALAAALDDDCPGPDLLAHARRPPVDGGAEKWDGDDVMNLHSPTPSNARGPGPDRVPDGVDVSEHDAALRDPGPDSGLEPGDGREAHELDSPLRDLRDGGPVPDPGRLGGPEGVDVSELESPLADALDGRLDRATRGADVSELEWPLTDLRKGRLEKAGPRDGDESLDRRRLLTEALESGL